MNSFLIYLVESSACLALFYLLYWFLLRKDTFFMINRMYLLMMVFLSMMIPLIPVGLVTGKAITSFAVMLEPVMITSQRIEQITITHLQWAESIFIIYLTGVVIFSCRFLFQLAQLSYIIRRSGVNDLYDMKVVTVDRGYSPFSFFHYVFINEREIPDDSIETILAHERIHIRQRHTIDLILMEVLIIVQWFNPFAWFTGRAMKTIHEFLADEGVLREGINKREYQQLIMDETMGIQVNNLTNNFNISLLKKRIIMMTKSKSNSWARSKVLFALPAVLAVFIFFSLSSVSEAVSMTDQGGTLQPPNNQKQEVLTQKPSANEQEICKMPEKQPQYPGGENARISFLRENIKYPEEAMKKGVSGKVFVSFVVELDGSITEVLVMRGIGSGCDEEAVRVIKLMPKWTPGMVKGKEVRVKYVLPIKFTFDSKPKKDQSKK